MVENSMSEKPLKKKFKKGQLIKVNRKLFENSVEANSSDEYPPEYIFEGPGEILVVKEEYAQVRWRRPVPDVWLQLAQLEEFD